jgi:hypothetical protein
LPERAGEIATALVSSGFAWGLAAFAVGFALANPRSARPAGSPSTSTDSAASGPAAPGLPARDPDRRGRIPAAVTGAVTLIVATVVYYGLIVLVGRPWVNNFTESGESTLSYALQSIARATALWLVGSLIAGAVLGVLGHLARTHARGPIAAGVTFGILAAEGTHTFIANIGGPLDATFTRDRLLASLLQIVLAALVIAAVMRLRKPPGSWPAFLIASVISLAVFTTVWQVIQSFRHLL